jgi:hypothetical protein
LKYINVYSYITYSLSYSQDDRFYSENFSDDEDEDDDYELDRSARFRRAYQVALATDTQGYQVIASKSTTLDHTPQELTAISWAAFSTELVLEQDAMFRIQALDVSRLYQFVEYS